MDIGGVYVVLNIIVFVGGSADSDVNGNGAGYAADDVAAAVVVIVVDYCC